MSIPLLCLLGFVVWTLGLVTVFIIGPRCYSTLAGTPANTYTPDGAFHGALGERAARAHQNCVENLVLFAPVVLMAHVAGVDEPLLAPLSQIYLAARIAQTSVHLASTEARWVIVRFAFFTVQLVVLGAMALFVGRALM